jgi:glucose dehydrogenase
MQAKKLLWSKPLGIASDIELLGKRVGLPIPLGVPLAGGALVTQGGLIFIGGTMDRYFRAVDLRNGREHWRSYLPGNAQATPRSYLGPKTQRQIVVITVPTAEHGFGYGTPPLEQENPLGGHIIAYALPD